MAVNLGGNQLGLNFKMGARDELAKMVENRKGPEWGTEVANLCMIIEAGLICNERIKQGVKWGQEPDLPFTTEQVRQWVYEMEAEQSKEILDFFNQAYGLVSKEADTDTQQ